MEQYKLASSTSEELLRYRQLMAAAGDVEGAAAAAAAAAPAGLASTSVDDLQRMLQLHRQRSTAASSGDNAPPDSLAFTHSLNASLGEPASHPLSPGQRPQRAVGAASQGTNSQNLSFSQGSFGARMSPRQALAYQQAMG